MVGEFANAYVLAKMKIATQGRWLGLDCCVTFWLMCLACR